MNRIFLRLYLALLASSLVIALTTAGALSWQKQWRWQQYLHLHTQGLMQLARDGLMRHQGEKQQAWLQAVQQLLKPASASINESADPTEGILVQQQHPAIISIALPEQQRFELRLSQLQPAQLRTAMVLILNDLGRYPNSQRQQRFEQLQGWFPNALTRRTARQLSLQEAQLRQLQAGEIVTLLSTAEPTHMTAIAPLGNSGEFLQLGPVPVFEPYPPAWMAALAGAALICLLLIGWRLNQQLERRIQKLQISIANAGHDQLISIHLPGNDELSAIADSVNHLQQRIHSLLQHQRQLSNDIAHELRTPVARSLFRLQALQDQLDLADHHPLLVGIRRDLHNLNALTAEILSHAQLQYSQDWQFIEIELQPMLAALISELSATSAAQVELQSDDLAVLLAEPTQLMRALNNLIGNALRYGQGKVLIRTVQHQDGLQLSVEDNGPGIAKEHRDKVWQAFYRADSSRPRNHPINNQGNNNSNTANNNLAIESAASQQGFGLGLAMVKRIIEAHQGQVSIHRSQRLGGCEVRLQLPVVTISQPNTHPAALIHS